MLSHSVEDTIRLSKSGPLTDRELSTPGTLLPITIFIVAILLALLAAMYNKRLPYQETIIVQMRTNASCEANLGDTAALPGRGGLAKGQYATAQLKADSALDGSETIYIETVRKGIRRDALIGQARGVYPSGDGKELRLCICVQTTPKLLQGQTYSALAINTHYRLLTTIAAPLVRVFTRNNIR